MSTHAHKTRVRIHGRTQRFKRLAFLLLLGAVLISLTAATANFAGAANATEAQPVVGATTHPIQYWIGCAPSMVTNATLTYFKQQGFTAVVMVVPDSQTYQAQLTTIKSHNMLPIIDIEMPIWDGGQLAEHADITILAAISNHSKPPAGNTSPRKAAGPATSSTWRTTSRAM